MSEGTGARAAAHESRSSPRPCHPVPGPASTLRRGTPHPSRLAVPTLCPYSVNAPSSSLQNPFLQEGPPGLPTPSPRGAVGAVQPRGSHPAAGGEGTTEGLSPCLAPHLRDPRHPEPVGEHHVSLSHPCREGTHTGGCPCLPADGEDGHLAGMSSGSGDLGGTERWQHLGPLLAAAGARGWSLHRVQVLLVVAGGGKLRQEVQPGEGEMPSVWGWSHHEGSSVQP